MTAALRHDEDTAIETLLAEIESTADAATWQRVEALVTELVALYGKALGNVLEAADRAGARDLLAALESDPLVAGILSLHDLRAEPMQARVEKALDEVRPYLGSHAGGVTLLGIEDGTVRLQLQGTCKSCSSSRVTIESTIRTAIERAAPEVTDIVVQEMAETACGDAP
jgi:Fe-S cluster biogenesis protein NfuA